MCVCELEVRSLSLSMDGCLFRSPNIARAHFQLSLLCNLLCDFNFGDLSFSRLLSENEQRTEAIRLHTY